MRQTRQGVRPILKIMWRSTTVCAVMAALTVGALAQLRSVADIANYKGADRQRVLEDGAKREGALMIYVTGTQIQPMIDRFTQKYPFIHLQMPRGAAEDIARQALEEYNAGVHLVDAYELNSPALIIPRDQGLLQPFSSPESADHPPESIEPGRNWIVARESYLGIGYNTNIISSQDAPKTYRDLLDPKWKGKMAISSSNGTSANWIGAMIKAEGMDYVRQLSEQNIRVYSLLGRALANLTISGEAPLSPTTYDSHVFGEPRARGADCLECAELSTRHGRFGRFGRGRAPSLCSHAVH